MQKWNFSQVSGIIHLNACVEDGNNERCCINNKLHQN